MRSAACERSAMASGAVNSESRGLRKRRVASTSWWPRRSSSSASVVETPKPRASSRARALGAELGRRLEGAAASANEEEVKAYVFEHGAPGASIHRYLARDGEGK